jgi:putative CocE/NonD family hydrolase
MPLDVPGLWFMSWYDVSVGPNITMFNHVRENAQGDVKDQQWAIIAPVGHCAYMRATENTIVGERSMGDARFDYQSLINGFFDRFLKGSGGEVLDTMPRVRYYTMGLNQWQSSDTWPPEGATERTFYLSSGGHANTLSGDGVLVFEPPACSNPRPRTEPTHSPTTPPIRSCPTAATCAARGTPSRPGPWTNARWRRTRTSSCIPPSRLRRVSR